MGFDLSKINPQLRDKILEADRQQNHRPVRAVEADQSKPVVAQTLVGGGPQRQARKGSLEAVVTLTACIRRELDSDNLQGSLKNLRDSIAATIGMDDGSSEIRWEYGQIATRGTEGVIVKIEEL